MTKFYSAPWDNLLKFISVSVCVFAVIFIIYNPHLGTILVWSGIIFGAAAFTIRGYSIQNKKLIIHRLGWTTEIDLRKLKTIRVEPKAMTWSWRLLGNGGLFGYIGSFRNKKLGTYRAFATNRYKCIVLEMVNRTIVVTPDMPEEFMKEVKSAVAIENYLKND